MINEKLANIRMLVMDVDGVLTDGTLYFGENGEYLKPFNVKDGAGIVYLHRAGITTAVITGRDSKAVKARIDNLQIPHFYSGTHDKPAALEDIISKTGLSTEHIAYIGDDLADLAVMNMCGLRFAPPGSCEEILEICDITIKTPAGKGAVREAAELILKASGAWEDIVQYYS